MPTRPSFSSMRTAFSTIYGDGTLASVGKKIGGRVQDNIEMGEDGGFSNGCAIRMSYSLNYSGWPVARGGWATVSGADKKWYLYRLADMAIYLRATFGKPELTVKRPKPEDFAGKKGILVFRVSFLDATGHATLWDGSACSDHCWFPRASEASLWELR